MAGFIESARSTSTFTIRLVVSGTRHRAKAANAGLAAATGALIHFLDDDDTVAPSLLSENLPISLLKIRASERL